MAARRAAGAGAQLLLLLLPCAHGAKPAYCNSVAPSPRIYIYDLPSEFRLPLNSWRGPHLLVRKLEASAHRELDGRCADFFLLPHLSDTRPGSTHTKSAEMIAFIRHAFPFWNASVAESARAARTSGAPTAARARHIMHLPCDHGPGDCNFQRPLSPTNSALTALRVNPYDLDRLVLFLVLNGVDDRPERPLRHSQCVSCFAPGVDIRLPSPHQHSCGPLCGFSLAELRARSPWAERDAAARDVALAAPRPVRFFWAGSARKPDDARARLLRAARGAAGWRVLALGAEGRWATFKAARAALPPSVAARLAAAQLRRRERDAAIGAAAVARGGAAAAADGSGRAGGLVRGRGGGAARAEAARLRRDDAALRGADATARGARGGGSGGGGVRQRRRRRLFAPPDSTAASAARRLPSLASEMSSSDFCGSPPGWDRGDSDRYLPALLFGCIPVFLAARESRPLEEALDWAAFSVAVDESQISNLPQILSEVRYPRERVVAMRRAMASAWERLLFSSYAPSTTSLGHDVRAFLDAPALPAPRPAANASGRVRAWGGASAAASVDAWARRSRAPAPAVVTSYLGEDGRRDAVDGLLSVLRARALAWARADAGAAPPGRR